MPVSRDVFKGGVQGVHPPPKIFNFFLKSEEKYKKTCGGVLLNIFFVVEFFSGGVEIFFEWG